MREQHKTHNRAREVHETHLMWRTFCHSNINIMFPLIKHVKKIKIDRKKTEKYLRIKKECEQPQNIYFI